jgi:hypothetical protein
MLDLCIPCKDKGKFRAVYKIAKGVPMCGGCFADQEANPPQETKPQALQFLDDVKKEKEGTTMAKRIDDATREKVLKDHAEGMNTNAIATKHGLGWITVKTITGGSSGKKRAGGGDSDVPKRKTNFLRAAASTAHSRNGASRFSGIIEQLTAERDGIDRAIEELKKLS